MIHGTGRNYMGRRGESVDSYFSDQERMWQMGVEIWRAGWLYCKDYSILHQNRYSSEYKDDVGRVIVWVWCSDTPWKVRAFECRMLHDELTTRDAMILKVLLDSNRDSYCIFCYRAAESCQELFFEFYFLFSVWSSIWNWLGAQGPIQWNRFMNFTVWWAIWWEKTEKGKICKTAGLDLVYVGAKEQNYIRGCNGRFHGTDKPYQNSLLELVIST